MTFPDPILERAGSLPEFPGNTQDVIPATERNEDPVRAGIEHDLALEGSRPLTEEERKAADRDAPVGERIYAPASERVPVDPVAGHRDMVEHTDQHTPEREGIHASSAGSATGPSLSREPLAETPAPGAYASTLSSSSWDQPSDWSSDASSGSRRSRLFIGIGAAWLMLLGAGAGVWLYARWQRERNKPLNRIRRQARQAASEMRDRVPVPEDASKSAVGLSTVLLSILALLWQQSRSRATDGAVSHVDADVAEQATNFASDVREFDWLKQLTRLVRER